MRYRGDDHADQPTGRRGGHPASEQPARPDRAGAAADRESSVFGPGYRDRPAAGPGRGHEAGSRDAARLGSWADRAAGKGPVRGFPPAPGQPPPLYPPGQFAAWNRHARPADGEYQGDQPGQLPAHVPWPGTAGSAPGGAGGGAVVGLADEPGYSELAVSDPAADVTSTQSWLAVDDSRAPGSWAAGPAAAAQGPDVLDRTARTAAGRAGPGGTGSPGILRPHDTGPYDTGPHDTGPYDTGPHSTGPHDTGPHSTRPQRAGSRGTGSHSGSRSSRAAPGKRHRPVTTVLAIVAASVLVISAVAVLLVISLRHGKPPAAAPAARPGTPTATTSPTPTLGPLGHIGTRASDAVPLTIAELYPAAFPADGTTVVRTASKLGTHCSDAVIGAALQAKVAAAGCSQVARATYLAASKLLMGTIGVLNLTSYTAAEQTGHAAGPSAFIGRLPGAKGPTLDIAKGAGIEEAEVKGHYLILVWAGFTNLRAPKYHNEQLALEQFMSQLIASTANVSLSNRMVNGAP